MKKLNLKSSNKLAIEFSMSSMTDIVFLLLIFFMISSSFDMFQGIKVDLPKSAYSDNISNSINIVITYNNKYYIDNVETPKDQIEAILRKKLINQKVMPKLLIEADKVVSIHNIVELANITKQVNPNIIISIGTKE